MRVAIIINPVAGHAPIETAARKVALARSALDAEGASGEGEQ